MWYVPLNKKSYEKAQTFFQQKITLDTSLLSRCPEQRKAASMLLVNDRVGKKRAAILHDFPLCKDNLKAFQKFQQLLILKGYSPRSKTLTQSGRCRI